MKKGHIVWNIRGKRGWRECFEFFLNKANGFSIIFQGDPNDLSDDGSLLNIGKKDFLSLPDIETEKYRGMMNSFLVNGPLTNDAKALFYKYVSPSFAGDYLDLWSFEFLLDKDVLLRTDDNVHCSFNLTDDELKFILDMGIKIDDSYSDSLASFKDLKEDIADSFSKEELNLMMEIMKDRFLKKQE